MVTKVFMSWSGDHSKQVAQIFNDWLPSVLQCVQPFFSPNIEKGVSWLAQIQGELKDTEIGIICVTPDNVQKPWLLFEAGALSKALTEANVCTICHEIKPSDVPQPLGLFQHTIFEKDDIKKLLETINSKCGSSQLTQGKLDSAFDVWWPILNGKIALVVPQSPVKAEAGPRTDRELIEEILNIVRNNEREIPSNQQNSIWNNEIFTELISKGKMTKTGSVNIPNSSWPDQQKEIRDSFEMFELRAAARHCLDKGMSLKETLEKLSHSNSPFSQDLISSVIIHEAKMKEKKSGSGGSENNQ